MARRPAKRKSHRNNERPPFDRIVLLLQGGGALGSYQAGVYQALAEANLEPDWVAGISIGAINCAIIAGNPPEKRIERLREFWEAVSSPPFGVPTLIADEIKGDVARRVDQSAARLRHTAGRRARILLAAHAAALSASVRERRSAQLLRRRPAQGDAGAPGGFRPHQRRRRDALQRRRGERAHRQLRLLRLHDPPDRPGAHHGERRAAARISGGRDRR